MWVLGGCICMWCLGGCILVVQKLSVMYFYHQACSMFVCHVSSAYTLLVFIVFVAVGHSVCTQYGMSKMYRYVYEKGFEMVVSMQGQTFSFIEIICIEYQHDYRKI